MGYVIVAIISYLLGTFAFSNIIGILLFKLPKKEYITLIGLALWIGISIGYWLLIYNKFNNYFITSLIFGGIGLIMVLGNIKNLKEESQNRSIYNSMLFPCIYRNRISCTDNRTFVIRLYKIKEPPSPAPIEILTFDFLLLFINTF